MIFDLNAIIRIGLFALLACSVVTLIFVCVVFLRRVKKQKEAATAESIATWLGGITAVGTFCIGALNVTAPIGILPEADPALNAIKTFYSLIQGRECEEAWKLIHPARKDILEKEGRGFGVVQFCNAYRTTNTYENLQITKSKDTAGIPGSRIYRVSYDVTDEFPNNRFFSDVRLKTVDALKTENVNETEIIEGVIENIRRYYVMALPGIEWVILGDHRAGSMQVRTLRRRYSSSRNP